MLKLYIGICRGTKMVDNEIKDKAAKLRAWLDSDEGKARMAKAAEDAEKVMERIKAICTVSQEDMQKKCNM
jgi:hypothetical protein